MMDAEIRDLRYHPYDGPRSLSSRAWTITLAGLNQARKSKWLKWLAGLTLGITSIYGVMLYMAMRAQDVKTKAGLGAMHFKHLDKLLQADRYVASAVIVTITTIGFFIALIVAGPAVSDDLRGGSFHFYFSRPVTKTDYILGKILPTTLVIAILALVPAILLGSMRIAMSPTIEPLRVPLMTAARALIVVAAGSLVMGVPAVALSALTERRGIARILWALFFLVVGAVVGIVAHATGNKQYMAMSIDGSIKAFSFGFMKVKQMTSSYWFTGLTAMAAYVAAGVGIVAWRVTRWQTKA
ncbi:MAG: ABC transporter permease subunit [Deltaproteobacteria bacterium]|nr:ABC transporter permease subunit [Deltaproteobacteria bacterium]